MLVAPVDVDVNVIVWPVNGCAGEYVNDGTGTAQAGATNTPTRTTVDVSS